MLHILKKPMQSLFKLGVLCFAAQANAADFLPLAKDVQPNTRGLPPAFVQPVKISMFF